MIKKILKMLLIFALTLSSLNITAYASSHTCETVSSKAMSAIMVEDSAGKVTYYQDANCIAHIINQTTDSGSVITILKDATLSENATLANNVYLFLPVSSDDQISLNSGTYKPTNNNLYGEPINLEQHDAFTTLTIAKNVQLTINGTMMVNSVSGSNDTNHNFITGDYAKVTTQSNSKLIVNGRIDNFGIITGEGMLVANSGAIVSDLLTIYRFKGGTEVVNNTVLQSVSTYPLNETVTGNIHVLSRFNYGSQLLGNVKIFLPSDSTFNSASMNVIGDSGLYRASSNGYITRKVTSYDPSQSSLPLVTYEMYNGGSISCSDLSVKYKSGSLTITAKISSRYFVYPITGNTTITLNNGNYSLDYAFKFLPGAALFVNEGATLDIKTNEENKVHVGSYELKTGIKMTMAGVQEGYTGSDIGEAKGILAFYDGATLTKAESKMPKKYQYATSNEAAQLVVSGIVNVNNGVLVGNNIVLKDNGKINIPDNNSYYESDSNELTMVFDLNEISGMASSNGGTVVPTTPVTIATNFTDLDVLLQHTGVLNRDTLLNDELYHLASCDECHVELKEKHTYSQWETVKEASYTTVGKQTRECTVCGYVQEQDIEKLVDAENPTLQINFDGKTIEDETYYTVHRVLSLKANGVDNQSGLKGIYYYCSNENINDTSSIAWQIYMSEVQLTLSQGQNYIYAKAVDQAGNESEVKVFKVCLEDEKPVAIVNGSLLTEGMSSCEDLTIEISETGLESVEVNGEKVEVVDNKFVLQMSEENILTFSIIIVDKIGNITEIKDIVLGHRLKPNTLYISPTCIKEGQKESYICEDCQMLFADLEGKAEIKGGLSIPIDKNHHLSLDVVSKEASYSQEGYVNRTICTDCGAIIEEGEILPIIQMTSISFAQSNLSMNIGESLELSVKTEPIPYEKGDITWISSDKKIVSVTDGVVKAISEGIATITVKSTNELTAMCTITVSYTNPFDDVAKNQWYTDPILRANALGLMTGKTNIHFGTVDPLSRAAIATVLYRISGETVSGNAVSANKVFPDVSNTWYTDAITWAYSEGVVTGHDNGTFKPNDGVTRQQFALMLQRYAKEILGEDVSINNGDFSEFTDGNEVASWAKDAMQWAIGCGIITGNDDGTLRPKGIVSRAQCAVMIMRFYDQFLNE